MTDTATHIPRLKERYEREIKPRLIEKFEYTSSMQAPKMMKITLNMGVSDAKTDSKALEHAVAQMTQIAGQKPIVTIARKSIAGALGDSADVGLAGIDGRELFERRACARRHDPRQRCLAGAGWTEQDHRADAILLDRATQWTARTDERFLADDKLKIVGSQTLRERRDETSTVVGGGGEEIAHALRSVGGS